MTYPRIVEGTRDVKSLPVGSVVVDAFAAVCVRVSDDDVLGWRRCTPAVQGGEHRHPPYLPGDLVWSPEPHDSEEAAR